MPSMPNAHKLDKIEAFPIGMGKYKLSLALEMYGEWILELDFKNYLNKIRKKMTFKKKNQKIKYDSTCFCEIQSK